MGEINDESPIEASMRTENHVATILREQQSDESYASARKTMYPNAMPALELRRLMIPKYWQPVEQIRSLAKNDILNRRTLFQHNYDSQFWNRRFFYVTELLIGFYAGDECVLWSMS